MKLRSTSLVLVTLAIALGACWSGEDEESTPAEQGISGKAGAPGACSFGFQQVRAPFDGPVRIGPTANSVVSGAPVVLADIDGDGRTDAIVMSGERQIETYRGRGNGTFGRGRTVNLPVPANCRGLAVTGLATGDFDGDKRQDILVLVSSAPGGAEPPTGRYLILYGRSDGLLDPVEQPFGEVKAGTELWHVVADFDGDGRDDVVIAEKSKQSIAFGARERASTPVPVTFVAGQETVLAAAAKESSPPALVVATRAQGTGVITWNKQRQPSLVTHATPALGNGASEAGGDLDGDRRFEVAVADAGLLTVASIGPNAATPTRLRFDGSLQGAIDLDADGKKELLFGRGDHLFAACGYAPNKPMTAALLRVKGSTIVAQADLDGDGRPDLVTRAANGAMRVYVSAPPVLPSPVVDIPVVAEDAGAPADGGPDASDGGAAPSSDGGADAGADDGSNEKPTPPKDEAKDRFDENDDDDFDVDDEMGRRPGGARTPTAPSEPEPALPAPPTESGGCSAAPRSDAPLATLAAGTLAAALLLARRRRRD